MHPPCARKFYDALSAKFITITCNQRPRGTGQRGERKTSGAQKNSIHILKEIIEAEKKKPLELYLL